MALKELAYSEISELVDEKVSVFSEEDTLAKVLGELEKTGRYEAVVESRNRFGLITVRDMLSVDQPELSKVQKFWRVTGGISRSERFINVVEVLIRDNIRALPVIEAGRVAGCISQVELMSAMSGVRELSKISVKDIMKSPVITLDADERIATARKLMLEKNISHVPVIKNNKIDGIVTAKMILHTFIKPIGRQTTGDRMGEKVKRYSGSVGDIMDEHPYITDLGASALDIVNGLAETRKSACIVSSPNGSVLGILTPRELIEIILTLREGEELPVYIIGISDEDFFERGIAEEKVRRVVKRGMKMHPHIHEVSIKISKMKTSGNRNRYEIIANIISPQERFMAKADGWNLLIVFDELCRRIDRVLSRSKHEPKRVRARRTSPGV
ncbi:CBS domain-containing protein [Candidatus Bathyarchaeota archaeon]|nr:CBS domain-containing protein [Candidatus Bathyarchaeota archaeon]